MKHKPREASPYALKISNYVALMGTIPRKDPDMTSKYFGCFDEHFDALF